jgi:hypothetical protein
VADIEQGSVRANGLEFHYLHSGRGPLALCYHGFPDSPWSYRHLLPVLAVPVTTRSRPMRVGSRPPSCPTTATTCTPA